MIEILEILRLKCDKCGKYGPWVSSHYQIVEALYKALGWQGVAGQDALCPPCLKEREENRL